jgi:hypothetical protein
VPSSSDLTVAFSGATISGAHVLAVFSQDSSGLSAFPVLHALFRLLVGLPTFPARHEMQALTMKLDFGPLWCDRKLSRR